VNGKEADLVPNGAVSVSKLADRLIVRTSKGTSTALAVRRGGTVFVSYKGLVYAVENAGSSRIRSKNLGQGDARAPMPGQIVEVFVEKEQQVQVGQKLLVLEAMKMQHAVIAPFSGVVTALPVKKGDQVGEGQLLVHVEAPYEQQV
jgi:3-methylcrotonyl-CoA carboxylase alpha subunit